MWNFYIPVAVLSSCGMLNDKGSGQTVELHFATEEKRMITKPSKTLSSVAQARPWAPRIVCVIEEWMHAFFFILVNQPHDDELIEMMLTAHVD